MARTLMMAADNAHRRFGRKAVGQHLFNTPGTHQWVCPANVTKISLAMVASGGKGIWSNTASNRFRGAGGNVRYVNDIPVIPGQTYTIVVPNGSTDRFSRAATAFGFSTSTALSGNVQGGDGAPSDQYSSTSTQGRNAGLCSGTQTGKGFSTVDFREVYRIPGSATYPGAAPGGGGGFNSGAAPYNGEGGRGEVRLIWGEGRAFPSSNILDV